jgi:hypothetical protein
MSELDTRLAELRDGLHEAITPPGLAHVADRARQRAVRRRMQVGAVAAVVAVSVAVPLLRSLPDADRSPAEPGVPPTMTFEVDFADAGHAYALGSDCLDAGGSCALALFASADGGRTWEERPLPDGGERYEVGELSVQAADRVVVDRVTVDGQRVARVLSADGGRTWRSVAVGALAEAAPLPDGAWVEGVCVGAEDDGGCRMGVGTLSPDGTRLVPAPAQPPLVEPQIGRSATRDGHLWAAGIDRRTGGWALSVSGDGGAGWSTTPVPVPGEPSMNDAWAVVEADGVLWATLQGSIAKGPYGLLAVFRSTDGGATWTTTWRATAGTVLQAALGDPVATSDGRLLVYSAATGTHETRDGRTFTKARTQLLGPVTWTRGGYVAKGDRDFAVSADGIGWRRFTIG